MAFCTEKNRTAAYALGQVDPDCVDEIAEHIDRCPECRRTLYNASVADDPLIKLLPGAARLVAVPSSVLDAALGEIARQPSSEQPPTPARLVSAEEFIRAVQEVELVSGSEWNDFRVTHATAASADAKDLADLLVRENRLTPFQAERVLRGEAAELLFGEYLMVEKIAAGGMGQVFKARHRRMKRNVAVKILPTPAVMTPESARRFQREVEAAARLMHPNIVIAHDAGEARGRHYLVMEYVEGRDLATLVNDEGPLSVARALDHILQVARGLAFAHARGVVHRDIKPANLLVDKAGVVKILDMGIARLDRETSTEPQSDYVEQLSSLDTLTHAGQLMGTIDYMAPEQARDTRLADERSDIYSLGCSLYFLLTGEPVFTADSIVQRIDAHREAPIPDLCAKRTDVPTAVRSLFARMVAKQAADRYPTMDGVIAALESCLSATGKATSPRKSSNLVASVVGVCMVAVLGIYFSSLGRREETHLDSAAVATTPARALADFLTSPRYVWTEPQRIEGAINTELGERIWGITDDELAILFDDHRSVFESRRRSVDEPFPAATLVEQFSELSGGAMSSDGLVAVGVKEPSRRNSELWLSSRPAIDRPWSEPVRISASINEITVAKHPALSPDGLTLLATTKRPGSPSADVWMFVRTTGDAPFAEAKELPGPVNTPNWDMPFFVSDDRCVVIAADQSSKTRNVRVFTRAAVDDRFGEGYPLSIPLQGGETSDGNSGFRLAAGGRSIYFDSVAFSKGEHTADIYVSRRVPKD